MLESRAERDHTTISGVVAKELDGIANTHAPELFAAIRGVAAAFTWLDTSGAASPLTRPLRAAVVAPRARNGAPGRYTRPLENRVHAYPGRVRV